MLGGFLFGALVGTATTVVSATLGASLLFLAARSSLAATLRARAGPRMERFRAGFAEDAASYLLFLRLAPIFPFWLVNLAPALLGARFKTFFWTTLVGISPGAFAYALAGAGLDHVFEARKQIYEACLAAGDEGCKLRIHPGELVTRELILALGAIGVLALLPVLMRKIRRAALARRHATTSPESPVT